MTPSTAVAIWTQNDRLCERCLSHSAKADDWLCRSCRLSLDTDWSKLTTRGYMTAHPSILQEVRPIMSHQVTFA